MSNELAITSEQMVEMTRNLVVSVTGLAGQMKRMMDEQKKIQDEQRVARVEQREFRDKVDELLNSTQLQSHEKSRLHAAVGEKVREIINSYALHDKVRWVVYKAVWFKVNNHFGVTRYTEILRKDFREALSVANNFEVNDYLLDRIDEKMTEIQQMKF